MAICMRVATRGRHYHHAVRHVVLNTLDRFHLVMDVANRVPKLQTQAAHIKQRMRDKLNEHTQYIHQHGEDMPEIRNWKWPTQETNAMNDNPLLALKALGQQRLARQSLPYAAPGWRVAAPGDRGRHRWRDLQSRHLPQSHCRQAPTTARIWNACAARTSTPRRVMSRSSFPTSRRPATFFAGLCVQRRRSRLCQPGSLARSGARQGGHAGGRPASAAGVGRDNLLIKVPATAAGVSAFEH